MGTKIDVDGALLEEAMKLGAYESGEAVVEEALREKIKRAEQRRALEDLRGIGWDGDLDEIRSGWPAEPRWLADPDT